jgi:hypothetical protein
MDLKLNVRKSHQLFVVNDRSPGNRRDQSSAIEFHPSGGDWIVVKFIDAAANSENVSHLAKILQKYPNNVVGICSGDDLRKSAVPISRALSWERTVRDVINGIQSNKLLPDKLPPHLVITFNYDAALYLRITRPAAGANPKVEEGSLVFSIEGAEGDFASNIEGDMPGAQTAFVSAFSALLYKELENVAEKNGKTREIPAKAPEAKSSSISAATKLNPFKEKIDKMLTFALIAKRRLLQSGFAIEDTKLPFAMEKRKPSTILRHMPVVYYSEGIFSIRKEKPKPEEGGHPFEEPPNPQISSDGSLKKRYFDDPLLLNEKDFSRNLEEHNLAYYRVRPEMNVKDDWSIFQEGTSVKPDETKRFSQFSDYVIYGEAPKHVPIGSFGKIRTSDVGEIEDFRTVRTLLQSYLSNSAATKPIGIAVFGPPGAGKGFSVKNITEALPEALKKMIKDERHECNLTALGDPEDLAHYFQLARNSVLRGKVPLLFFDEFDCSVERTNFYWLKHFLAPLQDGEFRHDHIVHPIGRAIFIFAGGVHQTYKAFADAMEANRKAVKQRAETDEANVSSGGGGDEGPQNFKGVDFLSRLHGHIDVKPFSPPEPKQTTARKGKAKVPRINAGDISQGFFYPDGEAKHAILVDPSFLMRRAITLRSMLELHQGRIFTQSSKKTARVNRAVVNALLATKTYYHGARSMEAIIRMSYLEGGDSLQIAHLPPDNQLGMHVDSKNFRYCLDNKLDDLWEGAAAKMAGLKPPAT